MTRRIVHLIEEQENKSKLFNLDAKVERTQEDSEKTKASTPDKEEVFHSNLRKESEQYEVTMPKEDKTQNGKRNNEMKITEKKDIKISKKREKIEKLQKVPEGTSHKGNSQKWNIIGRSEQHHMELFQDKEIYPLEIV